MLTTTRLAGHTIPDTRTLYKESRELVEWLRVLKIKGRVFPGVSP